jgi:hypothetical protein
LAINKPGANELKIGNEYFHQSYKKLNANRMGPQDKDETIK